MFPSGKKKILLIGDMPGWAFHNIILFVMKSLKGEYDFYYDFCIYNPQKANRENSDFKKAEMNRADNLVYKKEFIALKIPIVRGMFYRFLRIANKKGWVNFDEEGKFRRIDAKQQYDAVLYLDYYMDKVADFSSIKTEKIIRGIYTAGFPPKGISLDDGITPAIFCEKYLSDAAALIVGSPDMKEIYGPYLGSVYFANMAYDEKIFSPKKHGGKREKKLVLGWTGNPNREFKGYYDIIVPAIEQLKQEGYDVELRTQFSGTLNSLADFWQDIDVALIASEADAGPSLFMEASLCGVPSISTRIGMPAFIIQDGHTGLFCDRNIKCFKEKTTTLYNDRELLKRLQNNIRNDYLIKLGIEAQTKIWKKIFNEVLS
jgi:glycosyltransferase involved in cell wall biosynthesis